MGSIAHTENAVRAHAQLRQGLARATTVVAEAVEHAQHCDHAKQIAQNHLNQANAKVSEWQGKVALALAAETLSSVLSAGHHGPSSGEKQALAHAQAELKKAQHTQHDAQTTFNAKNHAAQVADQDRMTCISRYRNLCEQEAQALHTSIMSVYSEANQLAPPPLRQYAVHTTSFLCVLQIEQAGQRAQRLKKLAEQRQKANSDNWGGLLDSIVPHCVRHFGDQFVAGAWEGVKGIGQFGVQLVEHPIRTAEGLAKAFEHPGRLLKALVNPDLFMKDPGKWFGELAPTALLSLGTGGAGGLAEKLTGGAIDEAQAAGTLTRASDVASPRLSKFWAKQDQWDPGYVARNLKSGSPSGARSYLNYKINNGTLDRNAVPSLTKAHIFHNSSNVLDFSTKAASRTATTASVYDLGTRNETNDPGYIPGTLGERSSEAIGSHLLGPR